ncbi:sensor histidine kinase [Thermaerobacter sp. FW80]|uniref:HAMP domain-containing sensor histidine kinase n=1 Tax=Thermaerobacter sp. FW80 TaxID=2546351 RepID=UPI001074C48C|nr:sensor histidine kinase [Thermaerobacter sp. FW80]QBS38111.1 sensor histidine kinase [Thermaerobacter sp. FW80]
MRWIYAIHNRLNIFQKVLIANAVLLVVTGVGAAALAVHVRQLPLVQRWLQDQALTVVIIVFLAVGLAVSLGINWVILRVAFLPLVRLREIMDDVRAGQFHARAPAIVGDPDVAAMGAIFNEMLDRLDDYRRATASQVLRALEDERKRIARELHDQTSQVLTSLLIHLDLLRERLGEQAPEDVTRKLEFIRRLTSDTLEEIRRLTFDLRPTILDDVGLVPAVRWYVQNVLEPAGIDVELVADGFDGRLRDEIETALFRIIQEALTNILKHSRATRAQVLLRREPGGVSAEVRDNGVGFNPRQVVPGVGPDPGRGLGLFGMRERAALVGGRMELHSRPGQGTRLRVWIPLDGATEATEEGTSREEAAMGHA